jgi:hypothetical protein
VWREFENNGNEKLTSSGQRPEGMGRNCVGSRDPKRTAVLDDDDGDDDDDDDNWIHSYIHLKN